MHSTFTQWSSLICLEFLECSRISQTTVSGQSSRSYSRTNSGCILFAKIFIWLDSNFLYSYFKFVVILSALHIVLALTSIDVENSCNIIMQWRYLCLKNRRYAIQRLSETQKLPNYIPHIENRLSIPMSQKGVKLSIRVYVCLSFLILVTHILIAI